MKRFLILSGLALAAFLACTPKETEKPQPVTTDPAKAPQVVSTIPAANDPAAELVDEIVITYDKAIYLPEHTTISVNDVYYEETVYQLEKSLYIPVTLRGGATYTVKVLSPSVKDADGNFAADFSFSFTTKTRNNFDASAFTLDENLADPNATDEAKALFAAMKANFGTKTYSAAMAEVNWNTDNATLIHEKTGKFPAINAFDYIHLPSSPSTWVDYGDITPVKEWADMGGIVAASWHWLVPTSDPTAEPDPGPGPGPGPEPEPEYPDDVVIDFEDVVIGNWDPWQYLEASYFSACEPGTIMNVYYEAAAEGAQIALKNNIEGWPGLVDGNGKDYSYVGIPAGDGVFAAELDEQMLDAIKAAGVVISGYYFTICAVGLNAPGAPIEYNDTEIDFDDIATGNWADYKYLEPGNFLTCTVGSKFTVFYKDAAEGAQMAIKENSTGWPGVVDEKGNNYEYFNIPAGDGKYVLSVDAAILASMQDYGIIVGGHDYTIDKVVISVPAGAVADIVIDINVATGNWADYKYLEAGTFASCKVGTQLVIHYADATGAQMGLKDPGQAGWPGIVDGQDVDYSYFVIEDGEGDYIFNVDATVLAVIQASGLVIGGHDYTIVSLTIKNPAAEVAAAPALVKGGFRVISTRGNDDEVEYSFGSQDNAFNPVDALTDGHWQNTVLKADLDELAGYLKLLQDEGIPVLFRPLHEASGGWFWWGSKTGADFVALWRYVFDYLTAAGVHNLIWVWTSCLEDADWYPGDAYVDIIAYDWYPQDEALYHTSNKAAWDALLSISNKKMLTLGECGAMPSVAECLEDGAMWSWWMPWYGEHMAAPYNTNNQFTEWMSASSVITLDDLNLVEE